MPPPAHAQPPFVPELRRSEEDSFDQQEDVHPHLSKLQEASQAFLRGHSLPEKVQERLHQVDLRTEHARPDAVRSHRSVRSSEGSAAIAMLRRPATTRQAMVASFILGPPKALE